MITYYLVFGSNFGFPVSNIDSGIEGLRKFGDVESRSSLYVTEPADRLHQTGFVNRGVRYMCALEPEHLIWFLKGIEKDMERSFSACKGHRTLDIDVAAGSISHNSHEITIPHPALSKRRFMLIPLCELDPDFPASPDGKTFDELLCRCEDTSEIIRI